MTQRTKPVCGTPDRAHQIHLRQGQEWPLPPETLVICDECGSILLWDGKVIGTLDDWNAHVDRVARDPLVSDGNRLVETTEIIGRYHNLNHPDIGGQERNGSATYVFISDPHFDHECPYGPGEVTE